MNGKKAPPKALSRGLSMAEFMSVVDTTQLNQVQELWAQLDSSRKGLVSVIDLQEVMRSAGVEASFEDVSEIIIQLDSDGDGKISFKDFARGVMRKQNKEPTSLSSSPSLTSSPSLKARAKSSSPSLCSSPSTSLSSSPLNKQNQFMQSPSKTQKDDKEKESEESKAPGSPAKFIRSPSVVQFVKHLTGPQLSEMQTLFNHYDKDKDGRIDHTSVRSIVKEINPSIDPNDVQDLLKTIDSDRDGHVNFKEFIDGIVMVYRTNQKHAEKVAKEIHLEGDEPKTKKVLKQTIAKLQDDVTAKDVIIEQLKKQIGELQRENTKLKQKT